MFKIKLKLTLIFSIIYSISLYSQFNFSFNAGIGYYDYLYRPSIITNSGTKIKFSKSKQDYTHIGFLFGLSHIDSLNKKTFFEYGFDLSDRKRLVRDLRFTTNVIEYVNISHYSIYLDLPVSLQHKFSNAIKIGLGVIPSLPLYSRLFVYQSIQRNDSKIKTKLELSFCFDLVYSLKNKSKIKFRTFYSPKKRLTNFDESGYQLGGFQIISELPFNTR